MVRPKFKKLIFDEITSLKLNPFDFTTNVIDDQKFEIRYKGSFPLFVWIIKSDNNDQIQYAFTRHITNKEELFKSSPGEWKYIVDGMARFRKWLVNEVGKAIEDETTPDPWQSNFHNFLYNNAEHQKRKLTDEEITSLSEKLTDFKKLVQKEFELSPQQFQVLDEKVDQILEASKTKTIEELKFYALNILGSVIINLSFDHSQGINLVNWFMKSVEVVKPFLLSPL